MKLGDFFNEAPEAPTRPVEFDALWKNGDASTVRAKVRARFAFVDESARQQALRDAQRHLLAEYKDLPIPEQRRIDENTYYILHRALRDEDDPRQPFAASVDQLRRALTAPVSGRLIAEYADWVAAEFPSVIDKATLDGLEKEAEGNS